MANNKDFKVKNSILPTSYYEGVGTVNITGSTATLDMSTGSVFEVTPTSDMEILLSNPSESGISSDATMLLHGQAIVDVDSKFKTTLYTGNATTARTITNNINLSGEGGLVWIKRRDDAQSQALFDTIRGVDTRLESDATDGNQTLGGNSLQSFTSTGFTVGTHALVNASGGKYVSWTFKKAQNFFSMKTITHVNATASSYNFSADNLSSLGMVLMKKTYGTAAYPSGTGTWYVWHKSLASNRGLVLNTNAAHRNMYEMSVSGTTVTIAAGEGSADYILYAFADDDSADSIIDCGSYTGNGSAPGQLVNLGWEPGFLLLKNSNSADEWFLFDSERGINPLGVVDPPLNPNNFSAETPTYTSGSGADYLSAQSNGFTPSLSGGAINGNGNEIIYVAIRKNVLPTITYNNSIKFSGGLAPTSPALGETDVLVFNTTDSGTTYNASLSIDGAK